MMHLIKPSLSKSLEDLKIQSTWCYANTIRADAFAKATTLQPIENRDTSGLATADSFYDRNFCHSDAFWLTHWSLRLGLHSCIAEMNTTLFHYLSQLKRKIQEAERNGS